GPGHRRHPVLDPSGDARADRERAAAAREVSRRPRAARGRLSSLTGLLGAREAGLQRVLLDLRSRGGPLVGIGVVRWRRALLLRRRLRVLRGLLRTAALLL